MGTYDLFTGIHQPYASVNHGSVMTFINRHWWFYKLLQSAGATKPACRVSNKIGVNAFIHLS
jgi:hypothetical protein